MKPQCTFTAKLTGDRCKKPALKDQDTCYFHIQTPEEKERRMQQAFIAGSTAKLLPNYRGHKIDSTIELHKYLGELLTSIATGRIRATSSNLKDIANLSKTFIAAEERSNIIKRIEKIEERKK